MTKKNVAKSTADWRNTGKITPVQGQNYYVINFKFKLGHFIGLQYGDSGSSVIRYRTKHIRPKSGKSLEQKADDKYGV